MITVGVDYLFFFFFNDTATTEIYTLSLHDALPIAIRELSMESRMTVCNMSIEWGAKAGLIAPDQTTFDYIEGRPEAPKGADWDAAVAHWRTLVTDEDAEYDAEIVIDASEMTPFVTWGTNPGQGVPLSASVPDPGSFEHEQDRVAAERALTYMGLEAGTPMRE